MPISVKASSRRPYATAPRIWRGAIRTLSGLPVSTLGVTLADQAFSRTGPLTDPAAHPGQQTGLQNLFKGFFGAVRNLIAHHNHRYADPKEALELLLLADLLTG